MMYVKVREFDFINQLFTAQLIVMNEYLCDE